MVSVTKKDYWIGALAGLLTGVLTLRLFDFLELGFRYKELVLLLGIPVLWVFGVAFGGFLGRFLPFFSQFGKFAAVGFLGAAIDFSILNLVSHQTGINAGLFVGWINIPGFLVAVINNYFWNKLWVFKNQTEFGSVREPNSVWVSFPKFFGVTLLGLAINSGTIIILTSFSTNLDGQIWLNISKVAANALAMFWNFIGYKFIAFKK